MPILRRRAIFHIELAQNVFDMLADSAGLCAENHANVVIAFALRNPEERFRLRGASTLAIRVLPSLRVDRINEQMHFVLSLNKRAPRRSRAFGTNSAYSENCVGRENPCMKTVILDTLRSFSKNLRKLDETRTFAVSFVYHPAGIGLLCVFITSAWATESAPDGCYPNFTTAEGCDALFSHYRRRKYSARLAVAHFLILTAALTPLLVVERLPSTRGAPIPRWARQRFCSTPLGQKNVAVGTDALASPTLASTIRLSEPLRFLTIPKAA